jgi:hypothetical protein
MPVSGGYWRIATLVLLLGGSVVAIARAEGKGMGKAKQSDRVKIKLAHGSIEVTLAEGARIRDVVADALARSSKADYREASRLLRGDDVLIDPSETMRMGEWVLDRRDDDLVLQRPRWEGGGLHMIVAHLRRAGDGGYGVPLLDEEMYHGSPEGH